MASAYEIAVLTRGDILMGLLAGLVPHAADQPFRLTLHTQEVPEGPHVLMLLETLRRLGCEISLVLQSASHIGNLGKLRAAVLNHPYSANAVVFLDDDVVLTPIGAFSTLAKQALTHNWSTSITRLACNFTRAPLPEHTELWSEVSPSDPRVLRAVARYGPGWQRVFETGHDFYPTDRMGGACFCISALRLAALDASSLNAWGAGFAGEDYYIGWLLGPGVTCSGVYAYHYGEYNHAKWNHAVVADRLMTQDPKQFATYTKGPHED